jgi:hypothetical protein
MRDLVHHIAAELSEGFSDRLGLTEPADGYYDPVIRVLGRTPTKDEALAVLQTGIPRLTKELSTWLETNLKESVVRDVYRQAMQNNFGPIVDR